MAGRFSGPRSPTSSAANSPTPSSSYSARALLRSCPLTRQDHAQLRARSSSSSPPSSSPCTAAASRPYPPTSRISSAASTSPPSTAACSRRGRPRALSVPSSSTASSTTTSRATCPSRRPTRTILHIMTAFLILGFVANLLVQPVEPKILASELTSPKRARAAN